MDILYTLSKGYDGEELRYSLRSLQNLPHDKVFIVGGKPPAWVKNVIHIPTEQTGTKWQNVPRNLKIACQDTRLSANFIYFNDDFFVMQKIKTPSKELNLHNGTMQDMIIWATKNGRGETYYIKGAVETCDFMCFAGVPEPLCYELHVPIVFNKKKFLKMFELPGVEKIDVLHYRSLYGNLYLSGGENMKDVKIAGRNGFVPQKVGKFLSCDCFGFYILSNYLQNLFPQKCAYEV